MKRIFTFFLAVAFIAAALSPCASALLPPKTGYVTCGVVTEGINNVYWDQAEMLNKLGLFLGTGSGFALERGMKRSEAAAMLVRFLGEEQAALSRDWEHPFTDVPAWADRYVGWLWQNQLTKGTSATKFSSDLYITYWQYATFLSRACTGKDDFLAAGVGREVEQSYFENGSEFLRADAVALSTRALACYRTLDAGEPMTMARFLIGKNVFAAEQWFSAAVNIFPISYQWGLTADSRVTGSIADVVVVTSALTGVERGVMELNSEKPYFYAHTFDKTGALVLYQMDCLTLKETWLGRYPRDPALIEPLTPWLDSLGTVDGADYLRIRQRLLYDVVRVKDGKAETMAEKAVSAETYAPDVFVSGSAILAMAGEDAVYVLTGEGARRRSLAAGSRLVGLEETVAVACRAENGKAVVEGININTWTVVDKYEGQTNSQEHIPDLRQHNDGIYGEAGYYAVAEGRLKQITARPTTAVGFQRVGAGGVRVIVSHEPGGLNGAMIVTAGWTWDFGGEETVWLNNNPPHGINITRLLYSESSGAIFFCSDINVGMEHYDVYIYYVTQYYGYPVIQVESYEAGRPEMMEYDESWYVKREQDRLDALGYGWPKLPAG